jgi:hypothetical protein
MKTQRYSSKPIAPPEKSPIKTTFMELLIELNSLTKDDTLVMETVKSIFASHKIRLVRTLAPVRIVNGGESACATGRASLVRRSAAWR